MNKYLPETRGAKCQECPLGPRGAKKTPVPPELREGRAPMIVAEGPGSCEEEELRPLVGPSGSELMRGLREVEVAREDIHLNNALLCRCASDNNVRSYLAKLSKKNKALAEEGKPIWPSPIDCCKPRLIRDIQEYASSVLVLGSTALKALASNTSEKSTSAMRGFPLYLGVGSNATRLLMKKEDAGSEEKALPLIATYHPAYVLRARRWTSVLRRDIAKFFRHCNNRLEWTPPSIWTNPTLDQIRMAFDYFRTAKLPIAGDVETEGKESTATRMRCFGLGTHNFAIVIPVLSVDHISSFWTDDEWAEIVRLINDLFSDPDLTVVFQNGVFDKNVLERYGIFCKWKSFDTLVAHHVGKWAELPHDLDFLSSFYTDAPKHKFGTKPEGWRSDYELHLYNAGDVVATATIAPMIAAETRQHSQGHVYKHDMRKQEICRSMTKIGMGVDLVERARQERRLEFVKGEVQEKVGVLLNGRDINLGSHDQIRQFLFVENKLEVAKIDGKELLTPSGEPSTSREAIEVLLDRGGFDKTIEDFLELKLDYAEADKALGTFIRLREPGKDSGLKVWAEDLRIRPSWNILPVTGRLNSSDPNAQNQLHETLSIYKAAPGNVIIACDKSAIEGRLIAVLSNDRILFDAFLQKLDVHCLNASHLCDKRYEDLNADSPERQLAKTMFYAMCYGCTYKKLWRLLRGYYDLNDKRPYATLQLKYVKWLYENWFAIHQVIKQWHKDLVESWRKRGFIEDAILGRRRYLLDAVSMDDQDDDDNQQVEAMYSSVVQSTAAASVDLSTFRLTDQIGWNYQRHVGLVNQKHDALYLEWPENDLDNGARTLQECMTTDLKGMPLPCDLKVGYRMIPEKTAKRMAKKAGKSAAQAVSDGRSQTVVDFWKSEEEAWLRVASESLKDYKVA